ncbi:MAG: 3-isopropylmalate dehydratase small subunit [Methanobrevibacter sp. CfCl-M3]
MKGKVWKFGDDVDTDVIIPGRYLVYTDPEVLSKHCMEGLDTEFYKKVNKGDIIVGGKNFGCGSSREHAPISIQATGIEAIIAESFARIFYRNGTNIGMPLLEAPGISKFLNQGDEIGIYMDEGFIIKKDGSKHEFKKLPSFMINILEKGGLIEYLKEKKIHSD